jgi:hypothetical protein
MYINILQESCKIETFTEIENLQGQTTLYGRLQMYKEMKKIVEVGNGDEFPDFADLFLFLA